MDSIIQHVILYQIHNNNGYPKENGFQEAKKVLVGNVAEVMGTL